MGIYAASHDAVDAAWALLEARLRELPPSLAELGRVFIARLERPEEPKRNYFCDEAAAPLVHLPLWMRAALRRKGLWPEGAESDSAVHRLLAATMWGFFYIRIQDDLIDERAPAARMRAYGLLGNVCVYEMARLFSASVPDVPRFAGTFERAWLEFSEYSLEEQSQLSMDCPYSAKSFEQHAAKVAFARVPLLAVCARAGCLETFEAPAGELVHRLGIAYGLCNDVRGWEKDLENGHRTYLLASAGWNHSASQHHPGQADSEALRHRLFEGGLLSQFLDEARLWLERAAESARVLGMEPEFDTFVQERQRWLDEAQERLFAVSLARALRPST